MKNWVKDNMKHDAIAKMQLLTAKNAFANKAIELIDNEENTISILTRVH